MESLLLRSQPGNACQPRDPGGRYGITNLPPVVIVRWSRHCLFCIFLMPCSVEPYEERSRSPAPGSGSPLLYEVGENAVEVRRNPIVKQELRPWMLGQLKLVL